MSAATPAPTRLHISGLTPAISEKDLQAKLSSFGTVRGLDGFGAKDGNGDPRKFGYATLEAPPAQVTRCVTALSGTTWKGARLRIAPAKPDFSQRWLKETEANEQESLEPPKKKRKRVRGAHGVEAAEMEPVTLDNYDKHHVGAHALTHDYPMPTQLAFQGWYKTPLGHLIHPMRMRPLHPVPKPAPMVPAGASAAKPKKEKKKKNKVKPLLLRARRKKLDPSRYGATHLTGPLLENALVAAAPARSKATLEEQPAPASPRKDKKEKKKEPVVAPPSPDAESDAMDEDVPATRADPLAQTLQDETSRSRKLLESMFGGGEDEWRELDSDLEELMQSQKPIAAPRGNADADDFETVPVDDEMDEEAPSSESSSSEDEAVAEAEPEAPEPAQSRSLKEMFAPREEEAGFSLMANLDLDLELDDELGLSLQAPAAAPAPAPTVPSLPQAAVALPPARMDEWRIDADAPGIRPLMFSIPTASAAHAFWRSESDEQIRARWEERKGALTADYKKRAKEAKKRGRRGGAGDAE
ncbi:hypothetical protein AURDEDRAFT_186366 [Auricularia subglabra TFB-10046 SS5]|nr:hypothetical protein AURDEDRAFT_186366 [Auricularia subglabra TFB-10046 SS5]